MPMRNAYLIIAHGNYSQLEKLIKYLDCKNTDFYIHINSLWLICQMKPILRGL